MTWPSFHWLQLFFVRLYLHTLSLTKWWWIIYHPLCVAFCSCVRSSLMCQHLWGYRSVHLPLNASTFSFLPSCLIFSHLAQHPLHCRHLRKVYCTKLNCSLFSATRETSACFVFFLCAVNSCSRHLPDLRFATSPAVCSLTSFMCPQRQWVLNGWSCTLERGHLGHIVGWYNIWEALPTLLRDWRQKCQPSSLVPNCLRVPTRPSSEQRS